MELHVLLDDNLSFVEAHTIAEQIEEEVRNALEGVIISVHYEPYEVEIRHQAEYHARYQEREQ
jgi:divalent metal cation (Fe/Co/Zn/Cd) transporter